MTEQADRRKSARAQQADALVRAACEIVERDGLAGLTLRPLAEALGVSVSVLTNRYGARSSVMAAVCATAQEQDARLFDVWRAMLDKLGTLPADMAAEIAEAVLEDLETRGRALSLLFLELMHASSWDPSLRSAFLPWAGQRNAFWDAFAAAALPVGLRRWWHGYVLAELAYGLVLHGMPSYRILRRLCLRRLFAGSVAACPEPSDARLFRIAVERLQDSHGGRIAVLGAHDTVADKVARACGIRLAAQGVSALTHRAIAMEVGMPHTTLSYRFPAQRDLVSAGLAYIVAHVLTAVDADSLANVERLRTEGDGRKLDMARASLAVAIAATRMPELIPHAANMRSRRGDNLVKVLRKYMPDVAGIDALCVQVVSMGLTGLTYSEPQGEAADQPVAAAFSAAARWLMRAGQDGAPEQGGASR